MKNKLFLSVLALGAFATNAFAQTAEDADTVAYATTLADTASAVFGIVSGVVITIVGFGIVLSLVKMLKRK